MSIFAVAKPVADLVSETDPVLYNAMVGPSGKTLLTDIEEGRAGICKLNAGSTHIQVFNNPQSLDDIEAITASVNVTYPPATPALLRHILRTNGTNACGFGVNTGFAVETAMHVQYVVAVFTRERVQENSFEVCNAVLGPEDFDPSKNGAEKFDYMRQHIWDKFSRFKDNASWDTRVAEYANSDYAIPQCTSDYLCSFVTLQVDPSKPMEPRASSQIPGFDPDNYSAARNKAVTDHSTGTVVSKTGKLLVFNTTTAKVYWVPGLARGSGSWERRNVYGKSSKLDPYFIIGRVADDQVTPVLNALYNAAQEESITVLASNAAYLDVFCTCKDAGAKVSQSLFLRAVQLARLAGKTQLQLSAATESAFDTWSESGFTQRDNDCNAASTPERPRTNKANGMWRMTRCIHNIEQPDAMPVQSESGGKALSDAVSSFATNDMPRKASPHRRINSRGKAPEPLSIDVSKNPDTMTDKLFAQVTAFPMFSAFCSKRARSDYIRNIRSTRDRLQLLHDHPMEPVYRVDPTGKKPPTQRSDYAPFLARIIRSMDDFARLLAHTNVKVEPQYTIQDDFFDERPVTGRETTLDAQLKEANGRYTVNVIMFYKALVNRALHESHAPAVKRRKLT